jgi:hypothetical protein
MHIAGWPALDVHAFVEHVVEGAPASGHVDAASGVVPPESTVEVESDFVPLSVAAPWLDELLEHPEAAPNAATVETATASANHPAVTFIGFPFAAARSPPRKKRVKFPRSRPSGNTSPTVDRRSRRQESTHFVAEGTPPHHPPTATHVVFRRSARSREGPRSSPLRATNDAEFSQRLPRLYDSDSRRETRRDGESRRFVFARSHV